MNQQREEEGSRTKEKMYTRDQVRQGFDYGYWMSTSNEYNDVASKNEAYKQWFETNIK